MKDILIAWIAGSGKGTQSREIQNYLGENIQYFEIGNVFRAFSTTDNIIGNYTKQYTSNGRLLPDSFFKPFLRLVFACTEKDKPLLIDWFPRMYSQKAMFDNIREEEKRDFILFHLQLSEEQATERLLHRKMCPVCGTTYSDLLTPWITHCTEDNQELITRTDDQSLQAIKERFKQFHEQTERIINEYREEWKVVDIDGNLPIAEITKIMIGYLEKNWG